MPEEHNERTDTGFVCRAISDQKGYDDFVSKYADILTRILWHREVWGGRRLCLLVFPGGHAKEIIEELMPLTYEVCQDFLDNKVTEQFIEELHKAHRGLSDRHISVRTTLQYMFVNRLTNLSEDLRRRVIVNFTGKTIELFLKDSFIATERQIEHMSMSLFDLPVPAVPYFKDEVREILRHFRILLTRLADKGDLSTRPTPYECYCLYHDCFGTDRKRVVEAYVSDPEARNEFPTAEDWTDENVGALLEYRYKGRTQPLSKRKISCERKTISNRRREYQERLRKCVLYYMPEADPNIVRNMLDKRDVDTDTVIDFCTEFIRKTGMSHAESLQNMKTRTLENAK